jgi:hypothetical protein
MLNIEINNPELEESLKQLYGNNKQSIANAFADFVQQRKIKQDIGISISQLEAGEALPLQDVMRKTYRENRSRIPNLSLPKPKNNVFNTGCKP